MSVVSGRWVWGVAKFIPILTHHIHHHFLNKFSCDNIYLGKEAGKDVDHQSLDLPECQATGTAVPSHNKTLCVLSTRMLSGGSIQGYNIGGFYVPSIIILACQVSVTVRRSRSLLLCSCDGFPALVTSLLFLTCHSFHYMCVLVFCTGFFSLYLPAL